MSWCRNGAYLEELLGSMDFLDDEFISYFCFTVKKAGQE